MEFEFLPFAKPTLSQAAIDEVVACLKSGWLTSGPRVERFEADLKKYLQAPYALTLHSATAGLSLALGALDLKPGDEVITSAMTFVATLNTIVSAGGKPVLVDIDPKTYNIDVHQIEAAITPKTRAIIPVHFTGLAVDLDPIYLLAKKYQLRVIEDAAQAIGSHYKNKMIGSFGDTQIFSFHPNKNMTTGEGGCITTRDEKLAEHIHVMRFHGIDRSVFNRFSKNGSQHYDVVAAGFKYNMMDMQAALGIHQLADLEGFIVKRAEIVKRYQDVFASWEALTLPSFPPYDHRHSWHLFAPLINPEVAGIDRDAFMQKMKEKNIGTGLHYDPPHLYRFYREKFGFKPGDFPHAEEVAARIVSLPLFPDLTLEDQARVMDVMSHILKRKE